jgi:hypothetical protein
MLLDRREEHYLFVQQIYIIFPAMNFICTIIINFYVLIIRSNDRFYNVFCIHT